MKPLVSIIIPTYNRAHLISETLDSIIDQTYKNWECIVVDDGSTDYTEKVIAHYMKKDNRFQYYHRPADRQKGANSCRNHGFELCKGEFIKWFDSDDFMYPDLLQAQLTSFSKITDVSICKLEYYDFVNDKFIKENNIVSDNLIKDYLVGNVAFYISGPLWKKSFLNSQKELFDETISNLDDWDFNLRMLYQSPKITYVNEVLIRYKVHVNSLSREIGKLNFKEIKSEFQAREKHLKLMKKNKKGNPLVLQVFIKDRYKFILKKTLVEKHSNRFYFFKMLLTKQFLLYDFIGVFKTIISFTIFSLFNKGYILLK
nr:glycosyltransferase family 2 protein [uncultured Flavobacterium sp.]